MKAKRQSTVEPVFGTLTQFMGLRKVNTLGIKQATKVMMMAAVAFNIEKHLEFSKTNQHQEQKKPYCRLHTIWFNDGYIISLLSLDK
ncbi:transposase [Marivirga harenae]|uniref:transposase n=1 Tax=Marivirga harenae TaxID=2010992 RepID=UPI0026E0B4E0|nr:transposase [Marivirga harenae]WKV13722.1 transposase [Marivirga harenae]|tara:strand:- start:1436 stop:1696 length:261 start_codon:yes stop_codon:yes gene_type:complete